MMRATAEADQLQFLHPALGEERGRQCQSQDPQ
jgi:hypothetical protein